MKKIKISLFLILLTGLLFRFIHLGDLSFWCDEFLAIFLGYHPLKWMVRYITFNDAHPPLFYTFVHFLLKGGNSEFYLRILPAFSGILCIIFFYFLGKEIKDEKTGIILALIIAFNPAHILWSRILKSYSLFTFLVIISLWYFLKIIKKERFAYWTSFFISNLALLYLHNFSFIIILIEFLTLVSAKKLSKKWIIYFFLLFTAYLPWIVRIPHQFKFTLGVRRPIPLGFRYLYTVFYFFLGESVNPFNMKVVIPAFLIYGCLIIKGILALSEIEKEKRILTLYGTVLPFFLIPFPSTVPQNLIPYSIFWYLIISLPFQKIKFKPIFLLLLLFPFSISDYFYFSKKTSQFHDVSKLIPYREIGKTISMLSHKEDIILITEKRLSPIGKKEISPFDWYYNGKAKVIDIPEGKLSVEEISYLCRGYKRIYLFLNYTSGSFKWCDLLKKYFAENYKKLWERKYLYNERLLSRLRGKRRFYWAVEIYIFKN